MNKVIDAVITKMEKLEERVSELESERGAVRSSGLVPTPESDETVTQSRPHSDERRALTRIYKWADKERREAREIRDTAKFIAESEKQYLHGWIVALADLMAMIEQDAPDVASEASGRRNGRR